MAHTDAMAWELKGMQRRRRDFKGSWRRPRVRGARRAVHLALAAGREPDSRVRNDRHSALWDCW